VILVLTRIMERLLEELKKIEEETISIRSEAKEKSDKIVALAKNYAEKLILDSRKEAEDEASELLSHFLSEAKRKCEERLSENEENLRRLRIRAEKCMDRAVKIIIDNVVGKLKVE